MALILLDVDGPVADLHPTWLERYNRRWDDNLTVEDLTVWELDRIVKEECGKRVYDHLHEPDLYDDVAVVDGAAGGIAALRAAGHRVVFLTACSAVMATAKMKWLHQHGLLGDVPPYVFTDLVIAQDKSLVPGDVLIDDRPKNLEDFQGKGILWDAPYNRGERRWPRVRSWEVVPDVIEMLTGAAAA